MDDQTDIIAATPSDRAAEAFDAVTREVALLRSAIGGLAAERSAIPDYTQTLAEIAGGVGDTYQAVRKLYTAPALKLTPEDVAQQITAAGQTACEGSVALTRRPERIEGSGGRHEELDGSGANTSTAERPAAAGWRRGRKCIFDDIYSGYEVHPALEAKLLALRNSLGLFYCAYDLMVDEYEEIFFLEANPSGQWLWIEDRLGLRISSALADGLVGS